MANEITVRTSLNVHNGPLDYRSNPTSFQATQVGAPNGPTPGAVTVPTAGVAISLAQLVTPGVYRIQNYDPTNFVEYGVRDPATKVFYPWGEVLAGETYVGRFSRNLFEDYYNTGTGTTGDVNTLWLKANKAPCVVLVEAFEA